MWTTWFRPVPLSACVVPETVIRHTWDSAACSSLDILHTLTLAAVYGIGTNNVNIQIIMTITTTTATMMVLLLLLMTMLMII